MKQIKRVFLLSLILVVVFSLNFVTASAAPKEFNENFQKYDAGSYPTCFMPFNAGAIQGVSSEYGSKAFVIGNEEFGFTDHGAMVDIDPDATSLTLSFKILMTGEGQTATALIHNGVAVQVMFVGGGIMASSGQEDFVPVGAYSTETWYRVIAKVDLVNETYDLIIDDVKVADDFEVSHQPIPVNLLVGTYGADNTAAFDNMSIKSKSK